MLIKAEERISSPVADLRFKEDMASANSSVVKKGGWSEVTWVFDYDAMNSSACT